MYSGTQYGDVLLTAGTTSMTALEEERWGLVGDHGYAVLNVMEVEDGGTTQRLLQLKNPWGRKRWRGRFSWHDSASWTPRIRRAVQVRAMVMVIFSPFFFAFRHVLPLH